MAPEHELCCIIQGSTAMEYRLCHRQKGIMSVIWERKKKDIFGSVQKVVPL